MADDKAPDSSGLQGLWGGYLSMMASVSGGVSWLNRKNGQFTAKQPWIMLIVSVLVALACISPWAFRFELETDPNVLWVPRNGKSKDDAVYVQDLYPFRREGASFYAQLKSDKYSEFGGSDSALVIPVTWEMLKLDELVRAVSVEGSTSGVNVTYADICEKTTLGDCVQRSYLNFWDYDFSTFITDISGSTTDRTAGNAATFLAAIQATSYPDGVPVETLAVYGDVEFEFTPTAVVSSAVVIASDYWMDGDVDDDVATRWSRAVADLLLDELATGDYQYMTFTFITGSSVGDELGDAITGDLYLVAISLVIFVNLAILFLTKFNWVLTRTSLAILGTGVILLGIMAGWGLGMAFGMPFTPLQQLSPFILVGMGIDVIFVLVKSYEIIVARAPDMSMSDAFGQLMATSGTSAVITLLASMVAFALGTINELNSVRWFAGFATLNTLGICVFMITTFLAVFVLTERRIAAGLRDFVCCAPCAPAPGTVATERSESEPIVKHIFRVYYAPLLTKWWAKVLVLCLFTAGIVVSAIGITRMRYGQPFADLAPDGSYLQTFDRVQQETYETAVGANIALYYRGIDLSEPEIQGKVLTALGLELATSHVNASTSVSLGNWLIAFNQYAAANGVTLTSDGGCVNPYPDAIVGDPYADVVAGSSTLDPLGGCVPKADFYTSLAAFITANPQAGNQIIYETSGATITSITSFRFWLATIAPAGDDKWEANLIRSQRDVEEQINDVVFPDEAAAYGDDVAFSWNFAYRFYEGDAVLPKLTWQYFALSLSGIFVIVLIMLVHPLTALVVTIAVGLVILFLFGELWVFGIRFNQVSVINMIMATGLATDYNVYFVQKFMTVPYDLDGNDSRDGRMARALSETGAAVFLGGLTALIGTVPMAFANSVVIRTFFSLIFGTITFALLIGLMLMPVVFSLIGPAPIKSALEDGGVDDLSDVESETHPVYASSAGKS